MPRIKMLPLPSVVGRTKKRELVPSWERIDWRLKSNVGSVYFVLPFERRSVISRMPIVSLSLG